MINKGAENSSWPAFLIDFDLAIREHREPASRARGKTGTRSFMAIGLLLGENHSFWHDLESFFWVPFWICIHYDGSNRCVGPTEFDYWNYDNGQKFAYSKKGIITDETDFHSLIKAHFAPFYQPLIPCANRLRTVVFPGGWRGRIGDKGLYKQMKVVLRNAIQDPGDEDAY